jgi:hypothetical protein
MSQLGYNVTKFKDIDPSTVEFDMKDALQHNARVAALSDLLTEAHAFRRKVLDNIKRTAAYKSNLFLKNPDTASASAANRESLAIAQAKMEPALKKRYYSVPVVVGAAERRKALYGNLALDFEMTRLTTCDADLTVADVGQDAANRVVKQAFDAIKWTYIDKLVWEFRSVIKNEWDKNAGVQVALPVLTNNPRTMFRRGGKQMFYRNRRVGQEVYQARNPDSGLLLTEKPVVTGGPVCYALSPIDYLIDPSCGAGGMAKARYAGDQRIADAGELFERFVTKDNGLDKVLSEYAGWSKRLTISQAESDIWAYRNLSTDGEVDNKLILTDFYMRPSPGLYLPQGLHAVFATGTSLDDTNLLSDGVVMVWEVLPWPFELPYFDDAVEIENAQYYYGDTYARLTGPLNKGLNEMLLYRTAAAARAAKTVSFVSGHDDKATGGFVINRPTEDDTIIASKSVEARLSQVELPNSGALVQADLYNEFYSAMALVTNSQANTPPDADQKATAMRAGMMYEVSVAGVVRERVMRAVLRSTLHNLRQMQRFLSPTEMQAFLPEHDVEELVMFRDAELRYNTTVKLRQTSFFQGNPDMRLAMLARLAQFPPEMLEKAVDIDQLRELVNARDEIGPTENDRQIRRARAENAKLVRGPLRRKNASGKLVLAPDFGVLDIDNDEVHYKIHMQPLEDSLRENLSAEYVRRLLEHASEHKRRAMDARKQKLLEQIQVSALTQQLAGSAAGQPGQTAPSEPGQSQPGAAQGQEAGR